MRYAIIAKKGFVMHGSATKIYTDPIVGLKENTGGQVVVFPESPGSPEFMEYVRSFKKELTDNAE